MILIPLLAIAFSTAHYAGWALSPGSSEEITIDSSTNCQAPPHAVYSVWSCDKVYDKQEVCFLLYFLGQTVSWQYNPNLLD